MRDCSLLGYLKRMPTEYLEGILINLEKQKTIADYEKVCEMIMKIIKERK